MPNPPRIWLGYRPVRIGWVIDEPELATLYTAAGFNTCLWGGRFNPLISCPDAELAASFIKLFNVDVLLPIAPTDTTTAFIDGYSHLRLQLRGTDIFRGRHCAFVDIRHAVKRATRDPGFVRERFVRIWSDADLLAPLLVSLFGTYPDAATIAIDYPRGIRSSVEMPDFPIDQNAPLSVDLMQRATPLPFTGFGLSHRRDPSGWLAPGVVLGSVSNFDDLLLFWNLHAAGAQICFYDQAHSERLKPFAEAFLTALRQRPPEVSERVNFWSRAADFPPQNWTTDLDVTGLSPNLCRGTGHSIWNGRNIPAVRRVLLVASRCRAELQRD